YVSQVTGGSGKNYGVNIVIQKSFRESREELNLKLSAIRDELSILPDEILLDRIREALLGGNPYRPKQQESLQHLLDGFNTLAIFGTGRGKSAVFQTMAAFKALRYNQLTVIIYPLRALVNDQFENMSVRLEKLGLRVYKGNGSISDMERAVLFEAIENNEIDILLTTPEFVTHHLKKINNMKKETGLFVVDESHHIGISSQSHRPIYKSLGEIAARLGNPVVLAVTATANDEVAEEIINTLKIEKVVIDPYIRHNLRLIDRRDNPEKTRYLRQVVNTKAKTIIYVNSRLQAVELAAMLREELAHMADNIVFYHAGLKTEQRNTIERMFRSGEVSAVVSTSAFGEGIDIPDIKHVVVYHLNFSFTDFNQQCGRGGRNGREAEIHLICTRRDAGINQFILETSSPDRDTLAQLYVILKEQSIKSTPITMTNDEIAKLLKAAGKRFARPNLVSVGVGILEELGLLHREVMGRNRQIYMVPAEGKINLEQSLRFLEGQEEVKQFTAFQEYFFDASSEELLSLINRPIFPAQYLQDEIDKHG
ncbi:MAG TPA: DEAD/DEAH box helicase, partial [Desulfobacteria bacterium]|nr:DEAD/DEAH box helicase [Desulfobacteria bacterium]